MHAKDATYAFLLPPLVSFNCVSFGKLYYALCRCMCTYSFPPTSLSVANCPSLHGKGIISWIFLKIPKKLKFRYILVSENSFILLYFILVKIWRCTKAWVIRKSSDWRCNVLWFTNCAYSLFQCYHLWKINFNRNHTNLFTII